MIKQILNLLLVFGVFICSSAFYTPQQHTPLIQNLHFSNHKTTTFISAHRGGRYLNNFPENCIPTFNYTLQKVPNAMIELDVSLTRDSVLFLMHDETLDRTTTLSGKTTDTYWSAIRKSQLVDDFDQITPFNPSSFKEALKWAKRKGITLVVDTKRNVPYDMVIKEIEEEDMAERVIMTTYEQASARYIYNRNPNIMISVSLRNMEEWRRFQNLHIPAQNVIAFTGTIESSEELIKTLHDNDILCILGTMGNLDKKAEAKGDKVYQELRSKGYNVFATDYPVAVHKAMH